MRCCINCFNDWIIIETIKRIGSIDKCDYCGANLSESIEISILADKFKSLIDLYEPKNICIDYPQYYEFYKLKEVEYKKTLVDLIQEDWNLFNELTLSRTDQSRFITDIRKYWINERLKNYWTDDYWVREVDRYFGYYSYDAWNYFTNYIKHCRRFFIDISNSNSYNPTEWLDYEELLEYEEIIYEGSTFFRARIGYNKDLNNQIVPFETLKDIGAPTLKKSNAGRAAPEGIVYLYLASSSDTAIAETKPSKGDYVSVANVKINRELRVIDLTQIKPIESPFNFTHSSLYKSIQVTNALMGFGKELSKPINSDSSIIDYIPTQYIVELIQSFDFDGIIYKSVMGPGSNIVLFDKDCIEIVGSLLHEVKDIRFSTNVVNKF